MTILYPKRPIKGQSFKGVKRQTLPNQSMSLQEIIKRFVKRESLPVVKDAVYEDRYDYDLEKLAKEDITVQHEVISTLKERIKAYEAEIDADNASKAAKQKAIEDEKIAQQAVKLHQQSDPKA